MCVQSGTSHVSNCGIDSTDADIAVITYARSDGWLVEDCCSSDVLAVLAVSTSSKHRNAYIASIRDGIVRGATALGWCVQSSARLGSADQESRGLRFRAAEPHSLVPCP